MSQRLHIRSLSPSTGQPGQVATISSDGRVVRWAEGSGGTGPVSAADVTFSSPDLASTDVQAALDELNLIKAFDPHDHEMLDLTLLFENGLV